MIALLHVPYVQGRLGVWTASLLRQTIHSEVHVERLDLGMLNRVVVDDVRVKDQSGTQMLSAPRIAVTLSLNDLLHGKIIITSAQIFGLNAMLYDYSDGTPNYQFLIDAFSSDSNEESTPINLQVSSLIIRRSNITYNDYSAQNISAHIELNQFTNDTIDLELNKLSFDATYTAQADTLLTPLTHAHATLRLNDTQVLLVKDEESANQDENKSNTTPADAPWRLAALHYAGELSAGQAVLFDETVDFATTFSGNDQAVSLAALNITIGEDVALNASGDWLFKEGTAQGALEGLLDTHALSVKTASNTTLKSLKLNALEPLGTLHFKTNVTAENNYNDITAELSANSKLCSLSSTLSKRGEQYKACATIDSLTLLARAYNNIIIEAQGTRHAVDARLKLNDEYAAVDLALQSTLDHRLRPKDYHLAALVRHFNPYALHLSDKLPDASFDIDLDASGSGSTLSHLSLQSNLANIEADGDMSLPTLLHAPTADALPEMLAITVHEGEMLDSLLHVPVTLDQPLELILVHNLEGGLEGSLNAPSLSYNDAHFSLQASLHDEEVAADINVNFKGEQLHMTAQYAKDEPITLDFEDIDVANILNIVKFRAVQFAGNATGRITLNSLFDNPQATADLAVSNFHFESGALGTLHALANWSLAEGNINIDAQIYEDLNSLSDSDKDTNNDTSLADKDYPWDNPLVLPSINVDGYVSPKNNFIDLHIRPDNAPVNFIAKYTNTFLSNHDLRGTGHLNVYGPLNEIQLLGEAQASGSVSVIPLQTTYHLDNQHVAFVPNDIQLLGDTVRDEHNNYAILNAHITHKQLTNIHYEVDIDAHNILALDIKEFGSDLVKGTIFATGNCHVSEIPGGTIINIDATANQGSYIAYNAAQKVAVGSSFIKYRDRSHSAESTNTASDHYTSDLFINFTIHATPDATLLLPMDEQGNESISLQGNGLLTATLYNKGAFNLFGNYIVESGEYNMTIQKVLKRSFKFQPGGIIAFGGDPFDAQVNLDAMYTLNSVPLNDLNISQSFKNNNVRVDCLMNIHGTAGDPQVSFDFNLPTVGSETKQMIRSLIRDNEELNQQVIYLIAIGRFLNSQESTMQNARYSQTSLAMQSIISGTVSQQINRVLDNFIDMHNWSFGANISTGDEGFYNAEYEGLVSGQMFNNRLLFNGQFGYRDNPNATSSFIGDFDLRYLLTPSGNAAVRVYNQTNNKYFINNTLTTQGVGFVFKKQF